ncbi:MAG TPA: chromate transporter [Hyphomicrobiales bacterium]|nr:chromate transporter [Hyphomicrobiales bacterium]
MKAGLPSLVLPFLALSMVAIGGANATVPEMHRLVTAAGWMSDDTFANLFAISTTAPGPNVLIVTLIGWHVSGLLGALLTTLAFCLPCSLLTFAVASVWDRFRAARWRIAVQAGLVPLTTGLIAASAYVIARAADDTAVAGLITLGTAALAFFTRINPLWALGAAALIGLAGVA